MNIYDLERQELESILKENGIAGFRANQIWSWLYDKLVNNFSEMKNVDNKTIDFLSEKFFIPNYEVIKEQKDSDDGTIKLLIDLNGEPIEAVLMEYKHGFSVCVTTQIGCKIGCSFCASHLGGFQRDLSSGEIVAQVIMFERILREESNRVGNIVVMGIGEPMDNLENVLKFINIINDEKGLNIGARHITVSTSGIVPKIREFTNFGKQVNLAVSLHAPNNKLRSEIMKINDVYPIEELIQAVDDYIYETNRRVSFEYIMLEGINDSSKEAEELAALVRGINCHINIIPYNEVEEYDLKKSANEKVKNFVKILEGKKIQVSVRKAKGKNIDGACGQLRSKNK